MTELVFRRTDPGVYAAASDLPTVVGYEIERHDRADWRITVRRQAQHLMVGKAGADNFSRDMKISGRVFRTLRAAREAAQEFNDSEPKGV